MAQKVITIVGGTGFVGRYVVKRLAAAGYTIRVISRHPESALHLKTAGDVGQVVLMHGDLAKPETLTGKLDHSYAVINLVGLLFEAGSQNFSDVHAHGAEKLAQIAKAAGAQRFIQLSALGVDKAPGSKYARSKMLGEKAVLTAFPTATVLRPSIVFGPEDHFFNQFAAMAALLPVLPLFGGGRTRFQPVYAGDVAKAVETCLTLPEAMGRVYELGGPHVYTFKEILEYIFTVTGREKPGTMSFSCLLLSALLLFTPFLFMRKKLAIIPFGAASLLGAIGELAAKLPFIRAPFLTRDQVKLLHYDNVVAPNALTLAHLGIQPTAVDIIVPGYLARFSKKSTAPDAA